MIKFITFFIFCLTIEQIVALDKLITTDLKYEDVIEHTDASVDLSKLLFNITSENTKQQRLVFLNKVHQNENFLEKNIKKFTHLSTRWITFSVNNEHFDPKLGIYFNDDLREYLLNTEEAFQQEENAILIRGEHRINLEFMEVAKKLNPQIKIVPVFRLTNTTERDILNLLTDGLIAKFMAEQMAKFCKRYEFDGIVLDMWSRFPIQSKNELWRVYKQISEKFKEYKLQFFILVPSPINNKNEVGFFTKQDTEQLAPYVNGFVLNTFDYSSEDVPGPTQPIKWLQKTVETLVPRQKSPVRPKILVGISLHGNLFTPTEMKSLSGKVYLKLLKHYRPKLIWNDFWAEHYFNFKEANTRNRAFYPSLASLRERLLLVKKLNCGLSLQFFNLPRHADLNKIMSGALSLAKVPHILEPPGLARDDGKKPDGMTLTPWSNGKAILWDSTVRNTLAKSYLYCSSIKAGSVADTAERFKHNHYMQLKNDYHFTPVAFESLGPMGPDTQSFLNHLGKLMKKETGEPRSLDFLLQRISISIQRGNAACIMGTFGKKLNENFLLSM